MKKYLGHIFVAMLLISAPLFSFAQVGSTGDAGDIGSTGDTAGGGLVLSNPLGDQTLMGFLQDILEVIMIFAVPLIVFMIIYAGFLFVMDRGSNKTLEQAKRALFYAVIGGLLILGAWVILEVIQGTVDAFRA